MSKTDALYNEILRRKVVSFEEILDLAEKILKQKHERSYINNIYVQNLLNSNRIERIRRGLYAAVPPTENTPIVDKLLIASKIRENYYLGFHTALEYHGCAYSHHTESHICIKPEDRFNPFDFHQHHFKPVFVDDVTTEILVKQHKGSTIKVSSKERTFIECLDRIENAGGWEETLKSLENMGGLNFEKIKKLVTAKGKQILIRKTGYILELLKERSVFYEHLPIEVLEAMEKHVHGQPQYLIRGTRGSANKRWMLYIPERFEEKMRGI